MADQAETVELPDVVAFLAAHVRGDQEACRALLGAVPDGTVLLGHAIEVAISVACQALPGGRAELADMITGWQERRRGQLLD